MKTTQKPTPAISRQAPRRQMNWQYYAAAIACCIVLVAGFFFAARQHFSSMEYGLQNSRLRRQLDELQAEKRRLLLSREVSSTPAELKKAVRRIGFVDDTDAIKNPPARAEIASTPKSIVKTVEVAKPMTSNSPKRVVPTVMSSPVSKPTPVGKQARSDSPSIKKNRT